MKTIGLTGGIGSGKTTIARWFLDKGIPVYDSDTEAKYLIENDGNLQAKIIELFGEKAYINGVYNRKFISAQVFERADLLQQLNEIVHPAVFQHFEHWKNNQNSNFVIKEAAILFESGAYRDCDAIIVVIAREDIRIARVLERDLLTETQVRQRINNQWTDEQRIELADFIIENNGEINALKKDFDQLFKVVNNQFSPR